MKPQFANAEDAVRKLMESIVFYDGEPVYVEATHPANNAGKLQITRLTGCRKDLPTSVDFNDQKFDLTSPELGYVQYDGKASYCVRMPSRQNTIGISWHNISFSPNVSPNIMRSNGMYSMLKNRYETIEDVAEFVSQRSAGRESMTFHRRFALGRGILSLPLYFRGEIVGVYHRGKTQFRLTPSDQASFIARQIEKELGNKIPVIF
jgi:hypothetical protein